MTLTPPTSCAVLGCTHPAHLGGMLCGMHHQARERDRRPLPLKPVLRGPERPSPSAVWAAWKPAAEKQNNGT